MILPPSYLEANKAFTLEILNFGPRFIAPHPYTNQRTLTLARGPIIYCVEDADNDWETNHFKDIHVSSESTVKEEERIAGVTGEKYIALHMTGWCLSQKEWEDKPPGSMPGLDANDEKYNVDKFLMKSERSLVFVPYYYRANRGGRGHMRVGLNAV